MRSRRASCHLAFVITFVTPALAAAQSTPDAAASSAPLSSPPPAPIASSEPPASALPPPAPASSAPPSDAAMQPSLQPRPGLVRVDLASRGRPVRVSATVGFHLEGMVASPDMVPDLQTLCATPCTVFVSPAASALHVGDLEVGRVDPSGERILVNPGSRAVRNVGRGALIVGVIGTIGGVLMLALGGDRSMLIAGGATIGGSAAVGVTGFLLQLFYSDRMERSPLVNAPARGRIRWAPSFSVRDGVAVGAVGAF